jgi:hypothetical protein
MKYQFPLSAVISIQCAGRVRGQGRVLHGSPRTESPPQSPPWGCATRGAVPGSAHYQLAHVTAPTVAHIPSHYTPLCGMFRWMVGVA